MTIGIYALYWEEPDLVYVGQSQHIEVRFKEHITLMCKGIHTNYKVQNAYSSHGKPILVILGTYSIDDLNDFEIYWTNEFNSIKDGLNIIEAGQVGYGSNSNASKYSKYKILKVFILLSRTDLTYKQISIRCNVKEHLISDIKSGKTHCWLRESYPEYYRSMQLREKNTRILKSHPILISPLNVEVELNSSLESFCKTNNIISSTGSYYIAGKTLGKVIRGLQSQYQGWRLKSSRDSGNTVRSADLQGT